MQLHSTPPPSINTKAKKNDEVKLIQDRFSKAVATVLVDFRGVSVASITELRTRFRKAGVEYRVVKNSLVRKAIEAIDLKGRHELDKYLAGPTGVAWSYEDPSAAAKVLKEFRKLGDEQEKLNVKCGLLDGSVIVGKGVESRLASLPGKNEVRAHLLATLLAPAQSLVRQLHAAGQNVAYVLDARKRQLESQ